MAERGPNRKVSSSLVALSSAAIMAVYAAGYVRTRRAAERWDFESAARRRAPGPPRGASASPASTPGPAPVAIPSPPPSVEPTRRAAQAPVTRRSADPPAPTPADPPPALAAPPTPNPPAPTSTPALAEAPAVQASPPPFEEAMEGDEPAPPPAPADSYKDGTYNGWGSCRHGDVQVELVIQAGRIAWAGISKCYTRYPCTLIERLSSEVVGRQGPPVTFISGASESSDAFYYAVLDALSKAK